MEYNRNMKHPLPQNYRGIPARIWKLIKRYKKRHLSILIAIEVIFLISFLITGFILFKKYILLEEKRTLALKALFFWEKEFSKHPTYPEAYYNAALYAETVGDKQKALEYVEKSRLLDPNFEASKKLQQKLMKQED